ncbi:MAG: sulfatase-like hydrolase/transferase [Pirellulaceae bacterium]|nr:sulfatase-like hydrolase/transferase [Pirellulaceae bacterium]
MFKCFVVGMCFLSCSHAAITAEARKPNVIFILTDDQGSVDINVYGAKDLITPNMDALAERGVRFTQFYAASPVCAPSRAACMTGLTPQRAGVSGNVGTRRGQKGGLAVERKTMADMFQSAGYRTAHIGKWHLGFEPHLLPNQRGFDYSFGHMGGCIDNYSHFYYWNGPNEHDLYRNGVEVFENGRFFGDLMVEEATQFIQQDPESPFFIYFAVNMPHYPYQGDEQWLERYRDLPYPRNLYAAFISTIDERIGRLVKLLDDLDLRDDTILVFQSDHGHSVEERAHHGGGSSGPYRGHKFQLLEGGIRVPAMISWPGQLPAGQVRGQMVTACDWLPTLASLCDIAVPDDSLDGKDILPVIQEAAAATPHASFCWELGGQRAVRQGAWKLYQPSKKTEPELYRIDSDPAESRNLAADEPAQVEQLQAIHRRWKQSWQK